MKNADFDANVSIKFEENVNGVTLCFFSGGLWNLGVGGAESAELFKHRSFQFLLACEQFSGGTEGYSCAVAHPRRELVGKLQTDQTVRADSYNNKSIGQLKNFKQMPHLGDIFFPLLVL